MGGGGGVVGQLSLCLIYINIFENLRKYFQKIVKLYCKKSIDKYVYTLLWKKAQRQHWFIDSYIAAYIQVQYRVIGIHPTGLTVARGVGKCPHFHILKLLH